MDQVQIVGVNEAVIQGDRVELQLLTTLKCNLRCSYCSLGVGEVLGSQRSAAYSTEQLEAFVKRHLSDKEVYITLYGGEPTLNTKFALDLMDRFPTYRFNLQTNGTLLHRVPARMLARLSNINVSIDGGEGITDTFRGKGVYKKVIENVVKVRAKMFGSLTARVTWWSGETTFADLDELTGLFDYVYFQFAQDRAAYTPESICGKKDVLRQLVDRFFARESLYPVVPVMGIVRNKVIPAKILQFSAGMTQCRVSSNLLNVMPDGRVFPCPDMLYAHELQQGHILEGWVKKSPLQPHPNMPCRSCKAYHYCRGNCMKNLYLAYVKNDETWRKNVTEPTCDLIKYLGEEIDKHDPLHWFAGAPLPVRKKISDAEVYEFCEVMP
jgi:uncharacterized protein